MSSSSEDEATSTSFVTVNICVSTQNESGSQRIESTLPDYVKSTIQFLIKINATRDTIKESNQLFIYFLNSQISALGLTVSMNSLRQTPMSRNANNLKSLADQFNRSARRRWVYEQAQNVDLESLNVQTFRNLLLQLFHEGNVTWERVMILFFFCVDLSIRAIRERMFDAFSDIYIWTTTHISENLASWIDQRGGWAVVLEQSMSTITKLAIITLCCAGIVALCVLVRKSK